MSRFQEEKINADHIEVAPNDSNAIRDPLKATEYAEVQLKSSFDHLTILQTIRVFWKTALICGIGGFTALTDGYQYQVSGAIIANKGFIKQFALPGKKVLEPPWVSTFNGIFSAGQVIGQFTVQWVSDWLGRKPAVFVIMAVLTLASIVETVSTIWWHWMLAKLIAGIGIGAVQATLPVVRPDHLGLWWNVGNLLASVVLKARANTHPLDYKTSIYVQFGMIGLSTLIFIFLPETPWWAVRKGKMDKARRILDNNFKGVPGYDVERELGVIAGTIEQQRQWANETSALGPFAMVKGLNLKRFLIGSWPKVLQQFVGLAVFSSNAAYFFQLAGNNDPFLVTLILAVIGLVAVIFDAALVDKLGRRFMTLVGFGGACCGITLIAIIGCLDYATPQLGAVLVFGGCLANFFSTFQSSTSYAYLTEMPEQRFKARSTGWGLAYCNLYAVLINFTLPLMLDVWKIKCTFFFVCLGIPGTVLAYFIMPESAQRSPAEIQEMFVDRVSLRRWKGYKTSVERDLEVRMGKPAR